MSEAVTATSPAVQLPSSEPSSQELAQKLIGEVKPLDTGETKPAEATPKPPEELDVPKKPDPMGPKFAALARKEQEVRKRELEVKAQEKPYREYLEAKKNAKANPQAYLEAGGITYDELTEYFLNGKVPKDAHVRELEARLTEAEKREKEREESSKKAEQARAAQAARNSVKDQVVKAGETFELVNKAEAYDDVCDVIVEHYQAHGEELSVERAAKMVEDYLENEIKKYAGLKKFKSLFGVTETAPKREENSNSPQQLKTLTNGLSQGSTETHVARTREEEIELAAKMLMS